MFFNMPVVPIKYPFRRVIGAKRPMLIIMLEKFPLNPNDCLFNESPNNNISRVILQINNNTLQRSGYFYFVICIHTYYVILFSSVWDMELVMNINFCFLICGPWSHINIKAKDPNLNAIKTFKNCILFKLYNLTYM